jgi:adenylylsulfate kinase-like enzyme
MDTEPKPSLALGRVFWITGLACSGKTTTARLLVARLRAGKPNVVLLDGDDLRSAIGEGVGYSATERRSLGMRYARLTRLLANQGIDVVCATMSLFHECHTWCRQNIRRYHEIYLRVPLVELCRRDTRGLYQRAMAGQLHDVVGLDIQFEEPLGADLVIDNDGRLTSEDVMEIVWRFVLAIDYGETRAP